MKVILNQDVPNLGELGDVKDVAAGYARNFLLPRGLVLAYTPAAVALFAKRNAEIEARRAEKRSLSSSLKTRLEAEELLFDMPAGQNGKLYGAITNASVADELLKKGIEVDRKKIEVPGRVLKSVGNYKVIVRLYEKEDATVRIVIKGHVEKAKESPSAHQQAPRRKRHEEQHDAPLAPAADAPAPASAPESQA